MGDWRKITSENLKIARSAIILSQLKRMIRQISKKLKLILRPLQKAGSSC